jgi:hypothetical protein
MNVEYYVHENILIFQFYFTISTIIINIKIITKWYANYVIRFITIKKPILLLKLLLLLLFYLSFSNSQNYN